MLYDDKGKLWKNTQSLTVTNGCPEQKEIDFWDNPKYLLALFKAVADKDKKAPQYRDLVDFCLRNNLDFKQTKKDLKAIYKESKKMGCWEKQLVTMG